METYEKNNDILVFCITAKSFPEGVKEAHQKLHSLYPPTPERKYYGISFMNHNTIVYKAAVGFTTPEEAKSSRLEPYIIRKGKYSGKVIENFMDDISSVGTTFQTLLNDPHLDPNGYCLEEYLNLTTVRCSVKLKDE